MDASLAGWVVRLAALGLGLSAGALLAEGCILVPFWKSLAPEAFLAWYREHAALLLRFFGPLEVVPTVFVVAAAALSWHGELPSTQPLILSSLLTLCVLSSFPLYFRAANESFAKGTLETAEVSAELDRWGRWHWARTALAVAAFGSTLVAFGSSTA